LKENMREPFSSLKLHSGKISTIDFHPTAENILVSSSLDNIVNFWDINQNASTYSVETTAGVINLTWNPNGSILATCTKDNKVTLYDVRQKQPIGSTERGQGCRIEWLGDRNQIFCAGIPKGANNRKFSIFDVRKSLNEVTNQHIDYGSGTLYINFHEGMNALTLWGKGDSSLVFFELVDDSTYCHYLTDYTTNVMQIGIAFLPLSVCDIKEVEFARILKLTNDNTVQPHRLFVPRTRKEFFQDDIFPPTLCRAEKSSYTANQFFNGDYKEPLRVNLNPGLPLYSEAPKIERKVKKYQEVKDEDPSEIEEKTLDSIYNKMLERKETEALVLPHERNEGVDSDEWSD